MRLCIYLPNILIDWLTFFWCYVIKWHAQFAKILCSHENFTTDIKFHIRLFYHHVKIPYIIFISLEWHVNGDQHVKNSMSEEMKLLENKLLFCPRCYVVVWWTIVMMSFNIGTIVDVISSHVYLYLMYHSNKMPSLINHRLLYFSKKKKFYKANFTETMTHFIRWQNFLFLSFWVIYRIYQRYLPEIKNIELKLIILINN